MRPADWRWPARWHGELTVRAGAPRRAMLPARESGYPAGPIDRARRWRAMSSRQIVRELADG